MIRPFQDIVNNCEYAASEIQSWGLGSRLDEDDIALLHEIAAFLRDVAHNCKQIRSGAGKNAD